MVEGRRSFPGSAAALRLGAGVFGIFLVGRALHASLSRRAALEVVLGPRFSLLGVGLVASLVLLLAWSWRELRARDEATTTASLLRWGWVAVVIVWGGFLFLVDPYQRLWLELALGLAPGLACAALLGARRWPRFLRGVEFALFSLAIAAPGLELGLRSWAAMRPSPMLARVGAGPAELVERFRLEPGELRLGYPANSRGFYDEEPVRGRGGEEPRIVVIGDSFSVGMVPHAWHYTTVCEELLAARVENLGAMGIGPPEYLHLLVEEALPLEPDLVVVALFVGNDLDVFDSLVDLPDPALRSWFQRDQVLLHVLPARMARLRAEGRRLAEDARSRAPVPGRLDRQEALRTYPWLGDPSLEEGSLSPEAFIDLELERALTLCAQEPPSLDLCQEVLLAARRAAGEIPLRVLLIPDEFQVEDALWADLGARAGRPLERDRPQRLLIAWLEREGFGYLDLLPILRGVDVLADGSRHLYHRHDTHFNARGNEVAGRALAAFLGAEVEALRAE